MPFGHERFDFVIYNHVIEHVGERPDQLRHLREIHRVLKPEGLLYLAVPNRWTLVEPHYRLPCLSWFPKGLATRYVRASGRGTHYDCELLTAGGVRALLAEAGFLGDDTTLEALRIFVECEWNSPLAPWLRWVVHLPRPLLTPIMRLIPTLVFVARKQMAAGGSAVNVKVCEWRIS